MSFLKFVERNPNAAQAKLEAAGRKIAELRARGICTHGWLQGPPGPKDKPTTVVTCLDCGKVWKTLAEAYAAGRQARDN